MALSVLTKLKGFKLILYCTYKGITKKSKPINKQELIDNLNKLVANNYGNIRIKELVDSIIEKLK